MKNLLFIIFTLSGFAVNAQSQEKSITQDQLIGKWIYSKGFIRDPAIGDMNINTWPSTMITFYKNGTFKSVNSNNKRDEQTGKWTLIPSEGVISLTEISHPKRKSVSLDQNLKIDAFSEKSITLIYEPNVTFSGEMSKNDKVVSGKKGAYITFIKK